MLADQKLTPIPFDSKCVVSASRFNSPAMDLIGECPEINVPLSSQSRSAGSLFRRLWSLSGGIHLLPWRGCTRRVLQGILLPSGERSRCAYTKGAVACITRQAVFALFSRWHMKIEQVQWLLGSRSEHNYVPTVLFGVSYGRGQCLEEN